MILPSSLQKNDTIGIVCPSGFMAFERAAVCIETLQQWGFRVETGKTLGHRFHYFSGTDEERLEDIQSMISNPEIKAILCARGGYGLSRIIDQIDFKPLKKNPKWIIGYSDITLLHCHLNKKIKIASLHAPMAGAFNDGTNDMYIKSLRKSLTGKKANYKIPAHPFNRQGSISGEIIGGNLAMLAHCIGSASEPGMHNKILFLEDVGEYTYTIDRMLHQLKRAGWFARLGGLLVGSFSDGKETTTPFGKSVYELILEIVAPYPYPVCFDFPVGHTARNYSLKCGVKHHLHIYSRGVSLSEL